MNDEEPTPPAEGDSPIIKTSWARASMHIAWAVAAVALSVVGLKWLDQASEIAEAGADKAVEIVEALLQRKVEVVMATSISNMRGAGQAFHVAYTFAGDRSVTRTEEVKTLFNIPLGSPSTTVHWTYSVDLGIDLTTVGPAGFVPECEDEYFRCTLTVPDPSFRPPSIDTSSIRIDQEGALLVWGAIEEDQKNATVRELSSLTEKQVRSDGFWTVNREAVRANLSDWAEEKYRSQATPGEPAVSFEVRFASEASGFKSALREVDPLLEE
jgi:hypothetical protein